MTDLLLAEPTGGDSAVTDLLRAHREDREVDAVELIKAAPQAALRKALVYLAHALVVHLVAAVEHHHVLPQRIAQILHVPVGPRSHAFRSSSPGNDCQFDRCRSLCKVIDMAMRLASNVTDSDAISAWVDFNCNIHAHLRLQQTHMSSMYPLKRPGHGFCFEIGAHVLQIMEVHGAIILPVTGGIICM